MFIVTAHNKKHIFLNKKEDDFTRYLPDYFGVPAKEIEVQYVKNAHDEKKKEMHKLSDKEKQLGIKVDVLINEKGTVTLCKMDKNGEQVGEPIKQLEVLSTRETNKLQIMSIKKDKDGDSI